MQKVILGSTSLDAMLSAERPVTTAGYSPFGAAGRPDAFYRSVAG